jgi:hypothetical protein
VTLWCLFALLWGDSCRSVRQESATVTGEQHHVDNDGDAAEAGVRSRGEGVFEIFVANLADTSYDSFYHQCEKDSSMTVGHAPYGLRNPFWSAMLKLLSAIQPGSECKVSPVHIEYLEASPFPQGGCPW